LLSNNSLFKDDGLQVALLTAQPGIRRAQRTVPAVPGYK
jgi:hypothetical protein